MLGKNEYLCHSLESMNLRRLNIVLESIGRHNTADIIFVFPSFTFVVCVT